MTKLLIILIVGLLFEAVGVVYLNKGLKQVGEVRQISASEDLACCQKRRHECQRFAGCAF